MNTNQLAEIVISALEDIKARDIVNLDVSPITSLFQTIIIASADSSRQTRALANSVIVQVKEAGGEIYGMEGEQTGEWILVDCGDVIVHVMQPAVRQYYNLEELWGGRLPASMKKNLELSAQPTL